jgi:hypothetical protein
MIKDWIDVKTDIGWNRNGMYEFCREWENRIEEIKGTETQFKLGLNKEIIKGVFGKSIKYHVLIISLVNSGKKIIEDYQRIKNELTNVNLYILSEKVHPNNYKYNESEILSSMLIREEEFQRLFIEIIK